MKTTAYILTIAFVLAAAAPAPAQDTVRAATHDGPLLVWHEPLPLSLTGLAVVAGASPMFFEPARRQNMLVREEVQLWRRNALGHRPMHFDNVTQWLPLASVLALNLAGVPSRDEGWPLARRAAGAVVINTALTQTLKLLVTEWRPDHSSSTSFPSGHTAFAFSGAELLRLEYGPASPWIPAAGYTVAALTGFMRIYNDRHWTGDVLAGAAFGIAAADLSYWLNGLIERKLWNKHTSRP